MEYIQIQWTCANIEEARKIAKLALENKLAACIQIIPEIESWFVWKNNLEHSNEVKVVFKTKKTRLEELSQLIKKNASYEVPEILEFKIVSGNVEYLQWINEVTK